MRKTVVLDWVTVHALPKGEEIDYTRTEFTIRTMDRGTRTCKVWEEAYQGSQRIATISREPYSSVMNPKMILIKFDNKILYRGDFPTLVKHILEEWGLNFVSFSRIDIAMDYQRTDDQKPAIQYVRDFLSGEILKVGKGKYACHGEYHYEYEPQYLRFGTPTSDVTAYTYNKTREMDQKGDKPWIRQTWEELEPEEELDVWRLEFSIKASCVKFLDKETAELLDTHNFDMILPENRVRIFQALLLKYWQYVPGDDPDTNKARRTRKEILSLPGEPLFLYIYNSEEASNRTEKILIKKLKSMYDEMRDMSDDNLRELEITQEHVIQKHGLQEWTLKRGFKCEGGFRNETSHSAAQELNGVIHNIKYEIQKKKIEAHRAARDEPGEAPF